MNCVPKKTKATSPGGSSQRPRGVSPLGFFQKQTLKLRIQMQRIYSEVIQGHMNTVKRSESGREGNHYEGYVNHANSHREKLGLSHPGTL